MTHLSARHQPEKTVAVEEDPDYHNENSKSWNQNHAKVVHYYLGADSKDFDGNLNCVERAENNKAIEASQTPDCVGAVVQPLLGICGRLVLSCVVLNTKPDCDDATSNNDD